MTVEGRRSRGRHRQPPEPAWRAPKPANVEGERLVLVLFQGDELALDLQVHRNVRDVLIEQVTTPRERTEIDLWLDSQGGSAHAAYKIALRLREHASVIRVVVPESARSAATLLASCADELYLAPDADLGPLDAQIDFDPEGTRLSALDIVRTLRYIEDRASDFTLSASAAFVEATQLSRAEGTRLAVDLSGQLYSRLSEKVHPGRTIDAKNHLDLVESYGRNVLEMRNVTHLHNRDSPDAESVKLDQLVRGYKTHDYIIDIEEAKSLGLPVNPLAEYPAADDVVQLHTHVQRHCGGTMFDIRKSSAVLPSPGQGGPPRREGPGRPPQSDLPPEPRGPSDRVGGVDHRPERTDGPSEPREPQSSEPQSREPIGPVDGSPDPGSEPPRAVGAGSGLQHRSADPSGEVGLKPASLVAGLVPRHRGALLFAANLGIPKDRRRISLAADVEDSDPGDMTYVDLTAARKERAAVFSQAARDGR
jgi:hypothetical protein